MTPRQENISKELKMKTEEALTYLMSDERGRFFISEILSELTLSDVNAFTGNSETFRNLGQQQVFSSLKKRIMLILGDNGFNWWQRMEKEKYERNGLYDR